MPKEQSSALLLLALVAVAGVIIFERAEGSAWQSRLALPQFRDEVSRHTPLHSEGTFLPPRVPADTTLTAKDNPVILTGRLEIPAGVTLTIEEGVTLYAHEFAELTVFGALRIQGTETDPVVLTTNERHPQNKIWNGVILQSGAQADMRYVHLHHASPALTCRAGSEATLTNSEITQTLVGIFAESPQCSVQDTRIEAARDEIISKF